MALLVRNVAGPETARSGTLVRYVVTEFNRPHPGEAQRRKINWLVRANGAEHKRWRQEGDTLSFEIADELAGQTLVVMPYINNPTPSVSVVTVVQQDPGRILREGLAKIRHDFADLLGDRTSELADRELADRLKSLKFEVDDILDATEPLFQDGDVEEARERRLAVIVGHSERRPGARALPPVDRNEYHFNKEVALLMEQAAANRGIAARTFFRDGVGIRGAYGAASAYQPEAIIELHFNSFGNPSVRGTETLYSDRNQDSAKLALALQGAMVEVFARGGSTDRGVKVPRSNQSGYVNVTAAPEVPSALVEPFFGSNQEDCRLASDRRRQYAESLVRAIEAFMA